MLPSNQCTCMCIAPAIVSFHVTHYSAPFHRPELPSSSPPFHDSPSALGPHPRQRTASTMGHIIDQIWPRHARLDPHPKYLYYNKCSFVPHVFVLASYLSLSLLLHVAVVYSLIYPFCLHKSINLPQLASHAVASFALQLLALLYAAHPRHYRLGQTRKLPFWLHIRSTSLAPQP